MQILSLEDILMAAFWSVVIFFALKGISYLFQTLTQKSSIIQFDPAYIEEIILRCHAVFPIDSLNFNGNTFSRGMVVRITTTANQVIEGKFIGLNKYKMLCIVTNRTIEAYGIKYISQIDGI